jgi:amino acid adenylation domain-containing protein
MDRNRIVSRRLNLSTAKQALLERRVRGEIPSKVSAAKIPRRPDQRHAPLSLAQEGQWMLEQLLPGNSIFNVFQMMRILGKLDKRILELALSEVVRRHDVLRTNFQLLNGKPTQVVRPPAPLTLKMFDFSSFVRKAEREAQLAHWIRGRTAAPFDLARGELMRAGLARMADDEHVLLLVLHHIICDGWSLGVLAREGKSLYASLSRGERPSLPELQLQYGDYAAWQRDTLKADAIANQLSFWSAKFGEIPPVIDLPVDRPRPAERSFRGARRHVTLAAPLVARLRLLCQREQATLFMVLLAALAILLNRYSGAPDVVIGYPVANRGFREVEALIGLFMNTVAFKFDFRRDLPFREFLGRVRAEAMEVYGNQDVPFEIVLKELGIRRERSHSPLFQVMFAMQPPKAASIFADLGIDQVPFAPDSSKFDLMLVLTEVDDGQVHGNVQFATDLFDEATIDRLIEHFVTLLQGIAAHPDCGVSVLPCLSDAELSRLTAECTGTAADGPRDRCVHDLVAAQAAKTPDAVAVVFEDRSLTYGELDRRANQLAHRLIELGSGPEAVVGLCMERSLEMVVALLGIMRSGGAYLPLDPTYPRERLAYMLSDAGAQILITRSNLLDLLHPHGAKVVCLDTDWPQIARAAAAGPVRVTPDNLAYVLYTSGSTGQPKGVLGTHRALSNRLHWDIRKAEPGEVYAQTTTLNFIDALWEIFMPLLRGDFTVIVPEKTIRDPSQLVDLLAKAGATRIVLVPSLLRAILDSQENPAGRLPQLKYWACSGEPLPAQLANKFKRLLPHAQLFNIYGTSEFWDATAGEAGDERPARSASIGLPIANMLALVVDRRMQPAPINVTGQLVVAGCGLARGYQGRPGLTAERFVPHSFGGGERLYLTGDLAKRLTDGSLAFVGRRDQQVKVRGYRIELGEIETALRCHADVAQAVVVAREDAPGDRRLVAYLVPRQQTALEPDELREFLNARLPDYMVPAWFVLLNALPLTPSRKIDRLALPAPEGRPEVGEYVPPRTPMEELLASIWRLVLKLDRIGVNDNFFDLGGDSLLLITVQTNLAQRIGREVAATTLFQHPTINALASHLIDQKSDDVLVRASQRGNARRKSQMRHAPPAERGYAGQ